jgi:hypothetical protein
LEPEIAAAEFDVPEPMPVSSARFREQAEDTSCSISSGVESPAVQKTLLPRTRYRIDRSQDFPIHLQGLQNVG